MKEELLIYVWKYKLFNSLKLYGTKGEKITILSAGSRNYNSGPDFFNSRIQINGQVWAGNTEMHLKSSDWIRHKHHLDESYNNVILHVVFNHDEEIYINNRRLVVLELSGYIDSKVVENYEKLDENKFTFLKCAGQISVNRDFVFNNWIHSTYISRIERKNNYFFNHLQNSKNNWEYIFYLSLAHSFGMKLNSEAFLNLMLSVPFLFLKKQPGDIKAMEAMLFGQAGFLNRNDASVGDIYYSELLKEYNFLKSKYSLRTMQGKQFSFFRTRPHNFPCIRISQLAALLTFKDDLFGSVLNAASVKELRNLFCVEASEYWNNHYVFFKQSKYSRKILSESFLNRLILNCVIPFRVLYFKNMSQHQKLESSIELAYSLEDEHNSVTREFEQIGFVAENATESQVQLELKEIFCLKNACLSCHIGKQILEKA